MISSFQKTKPRARRLFLVAFLCKQQFSGALGYGLLYFEKRRTLSAIGNPTQNIIIKQLMTRLESGGAVRIGNADSGNTTKFMNR
jgi:hypothetical protein